MKHGYDFKTIPDAFLANASIQESINDRGIKVYSVYIPAESFNGASDTLVDFFNQYVINNSVKLLTSTN